MSKAEGRNVYLKDVIPSPEALHYAQITGKDARFVEVVLSESHTVSRAAPNVFIVTHRLGFTCANAGIDQSNIEGEYVLLLPHDPDASARYFREQMYQHTGKQVGIVISDSHGRPFRLGTTGTAIGAAGVSALYDLRGQTDLFGRVLQVSILAYSDLLASTALLVMGEGSEGFPVALIQGLVSPTPHGSASDLNRPTHEDLYS